MSPPGGGLSRSDQKNHIVCNILLVYLARVMYHPRLGMAIVQRQYVE